MQVVTVVEYDFAGKWCEHRELWQFRMRKRAQIAFPGWLLWYLRASLRQGTQPCHSEIRPGVSRDSSADLGMT